MHGGANAGFSPTLFLYEHIPGGIGLSERIYEQRVTLIVRVLRLIEKCPCEQGCPACVGPSDATRKAVALKPLRHAVPTASAMGTKARALLVFLLACQASLGCSRGARSKT